MKKVLISTIIIGVMLLIVVGGLFYYFKVSTSGGVGDTTTTSEDGFATLTATFYDFSGDSVNGGGVVQSLIGGTDKRTHVKFDMSASNTGQINLENVRVTAPNANMNGAFDNINPLANLNVGQSGISVGSSAQSCSNVGGTVCDALGSGGCDANEQCCPTDECLISLDEYASGTTQNNVAFTISLTGDFKNAQGQTDSVTSDPVTLTYDIREEICSDTTPINTCVFARTAIDSDKPKYCNHVDGSLPSIINKASICGCPVGYEISGENCVASTCSDGTAVGECSVNNEDNYGAYYYCNPSKVLEPACNQCGCTDDYYGNPSTGCSGGSDPASCNYQTYQGELEGTLNE